MATYKVVDADQLDADMTSVADSIRAKGNTTNKLVWPDGYKTAIDAIQTGGGGITPSGTKQITANGTYDVTNYAFAEVNVPTGGGDSEEEWIGDGNTHIWISLQEGRTSPMLGVCPNGTVSVDWGDGTTPDVLTGSSTSTVKWTPKHNYAAAGDYVITLTVGGTLGLYGTGNRTAGSGLMRYSSGNDPRNYGYHSAIRKVEIGNGVTSIGNYAFYGCFALASIRIPDSVTSIGNYAFYDCFALASIRIPDSVTSIGNSAISYCYALASIRIPDSVTSIGSSAFSDCYALASIHISEDVTGLSDSMFINCYSLASANIPDGVTNIGSYAFYDCCSLAKLRFNPATPPTVTNSNAFTDVPTDCIISVPRGALAAYTSATNYPAPATYTYIEED